MRKRILWGLSFGVLAACGGGTEPAATAAPAAEPAKPVSRAEAVVRQPDYDSSEMKLVERRYVDGIALQTSEGPAALLTTTAMDACTRLAVLARGSADFGVFAGDGTPALVVVRNEEYPQGSVQLVEPGVTTFLATAIPTLQADGDRLVAKGQEAGNEPFSDKPSLEYDVDLAYASMAGHDPLAADAGPEAAWLRGLARQADADVEATVAATFIEDEDDWNNYGSRSTWFDLLSSWEDFSVVAAASEADCATLVVQAPGFAGGARRAIVRARGAGEQRKVFAAESSEDYGSEGNYFVGRVEHPTLGDFPILDARADATPDGGALVVFSDKPIGDAPWEQLVQSQRAVRAVAHSRYETIYMLGGLEFGGPGMAAQAVEAGTITNAYIDDSAIAGLINQGNPGEPRIVVNFHLPLAAPADAAPAQ